MRHAQKARVPTYIYLLYSQGLDELLLKKLFILRCCGNII